MAYKEIIITTKLLGDWCAASNHQPVKCWGGQTMAIENILSMKKRVHQVHQSTEGTAILLGLTPK